MARRSRNLSGPAVAPLVQVDAGIGDRRDVPPITESFRGAAFGIFALALALRLLNLASLRAAPFYEVLLGDAAGYDAWGQAIAAGDWIGEHVFYQAPLYPYFLGVFYRFIGHDLTAVRATQALFGSASCVLIALAARNLFGARPGLVAGVLLALYAPAIFFDGLIQKTSLDLLLFSLMLWLLSSMVERVNWTAAFGLGLSLGALILTRENALIFAPVILVWMIRRDREPMRTTIAFAAAVGLVLAPVTIRNFAISGEWHLTTAQFGPNLYIGNHAGATGSYVPLRKGRGNQAFERDDAIHIAESVRGHSLGPREVSGYWRDEALAWIGAHPVEWLRLTSKKVLLALNAVEATDTEDLYSHAERSSVLRLTDVLFHFGVLGPLGFLGMWLVRRHWRELGIFYVLCASYLLSVVVFYVVARYRFPLTPFLVLFASAAVAELPAWWKKQGTNDRAAASGLFLFTAVLCNWPVQSTTSMRALTRYNLAETLHGQGRNDDAIAQFKASLALDPDQAAALSNLGGLLAERGDHVEALALYERAIAADPTNAAAHNNRGQELTLRARIPEAVQAFQRSIGLDPLSPEAHRNLAMALASSDQNDEAILEFEKALRLTSDDPVTHNNLGIALASAGRLSDSAHHFREALRIRPDFAEAAANLKKVEGLLNGTQGVPGGVQ